MHNVVAVVVVVVFRCAVVVVVIVFIVVVVGAVVVVIIVSVVLCRCCHRHRRHGMNVRSFVWLLLVFLAIVCWFFCSACLESAAGWFLRWFVQRLLLLFEVCT